MRFLLASCPSPTSRSDGCEGISIHLKIVKLTLLIHLLEEALHLTNGDGHALFSGNLDHALKRCLRISRQQSEQLFLGFSGQLCP